MLMIEISPSAPKDETPTADQASGVSREQAEMFDLNAFCPKTLLAVTKGASWCCDFTQREVNCCRWPDDRAH